jgi:hypothetical protein
MATKSQSFLHISGPMATALAAHIDGATSNADILCRAGFPYPIAIELAAQMKAGIGNVAKLHAGCHFSASDSVAIAAAITAAGIH